MGAFREAAAAFLATKLPVFKLPPAVPIEAVESSRLTHPITVEGIPNELTLVSCYGRSIQVSENWKGEQQDTVKEHSARCLRWSEIVVTRELGNH